MSAIAENFTAINQAIAQRTDYAVRVMAVAKLQPIEKLREALAAGVVLLGVNYVQEGEEQRKLLEGVKVEWHFIGHIQSRKVKVLPEYDCVESIDRFEIAKSLNERCAAAAKKMPILVEVNVGEESQKSGILPADLKSFLQGLKRFEHLIPSGLMLMPPPLDVEARRPFFKRGSEWFRDYQNEFPFTMLSMGTSDDYLIAVEEGSTLVRLGTCLLGKR